MKYTKRQIKEAIAYWEGRLRSETRGMISESMEYDSLDDVYGELVDRVIPRDKALYGKLTQLYGEKFPGGKAGDDDFVNWILDFVGPTFDRVMKKQLKAGVDQVLAEVRAMADKKLKQGGRRKVNEEVDHGQIKMDIEAQLAERDDIPNYLKSRIHDLVVDNAGYDGIEYDSQQVDIYANAWKRERVITVTAMDGTNGPGINIPTNAVPLKVTPDQILDYVRRQNPNAQPLCVKIEFDWEVGTFVHGFGGEFDDDDWREDIMAADEIPIDLDDDGDAARICSPYENRVCTVDDSGVTS